jgi:hypothetical protein
MAIITNAGLSVSHLARFDDVPVGQVALTARFRVVRRSHQ